MEQASACKKGQDPREKARTEKIVARVEAEQAASRTYENVLKAYLKEEVRGRKKNRTADQTERRFEMYVTPRWKGCLVTEISRSDVHVLLSDVRDSKIELEGRNYGGPLIVNRVLAAIRAMFNWWQIQDDQFVSPIVRGMAKARETKRTCVLSDDELRSMVIASRMRCLRFNC